MSWLLEGTPPPHPTHPPRKKIRRSSTYFFSGVVVPQQHAQWSAFWGERASRYVVYWTRKGKYLFISCFLFLSLSPFPPCRDGGGGKKKGLAGAPGPSTFESPKMFFFFQGKKQKRNGGKNWTRPAGSLFFFFFFFSYFSFSFFFNIFFFMSCWPPIPWSAFDSILKSKWTLFIGRLMAWTDNGFVWSSVGLFSFYWPLVRLTMMNVTL